MDEKFRAVDGPDNCDRGAHLREINVPARGVLMMTGPARGLKPAVSTRIYQ